jgi:tetratricopeptide (TPR) repeat protein
LGECLLLLGEKEEGINAYRKAFELNPKNTHAREIIEQAE